MKRRLAAVCRMAVLTFLAALLCSPLILTALASMKSGKELTDQLIPVLSGSMTGEGWHALPLYPTLRHYIRLLFETPEFFTVFWNSFRMTGLILAGQAVVAIPAGWALAKFSFPGRRILLLVYTVLMLLPFQLRMLPEYLVLDRLGLMNTQACVIIPAVFSTLPVFIIYRGFLGIPDEVIQAARVDGAGEYAVFFRIGLPLGMPGIMSALVLGFLEYWNMMEQPLAFIQDKSLWPMSLYLPEIRPEQAGIALAASVLFLVPAAFVFALGQDYLEQGIVATGMKG